MTNIKHGHYVPLGHSRRFQGIPISFTKVSGVWTSFYLKAQVMGSILLNEKGINLGVVSEG